MPTNMSRLIARVLCLAAVPVPWLPAQSPFRATRQTSLPAGLSPAAVVTGDVDGDGDLDLVLGNANQRPIQLLLNDGSGSFTDESATRLPNPTTGFATYAIDLADVNGDGYLDLVFCNAQNLPNGVYLNLGSGYFVDLSSALLPSNAVTTVDQILGDFDGDGDLDWFLVDRPQAHLWLNDGQGGFSDASANLLGLPANLGFWYSRGSAGDLDGDGDLDLLVPAYPLPVIVWNLGHAVFQPAATSLPIPAYFFGTNRIVDLDGDGDLDLLLDHGGYVLLNDGSGHFSNATAQAYGGMAVSSPAAFDVDRDGFMDVLTSTMLWRNQGNARFVASPLPATVGLVGILHTVAGDFDGDGDLDLAGLANFATQLEALAPPQPGQDFTLDCHTRPAVSSIAAVVAAFGTGHAPLGWLGVVRLDTSAMATVALQVVTTSPLQVRWTIPSWTSLRGVPLHYQALVVDPLAGAHLTNCWSEVVQ